MLRTLLPARFGSASPLALAAALAAAAMLGTAFTPAEAQQRRQQQQAQPAAEQQQPSNSEAFVAAYQPVAAIVSTEGADLAPARAQLDQVYAAISTPDDRHAAGNLALVIGTRLSDPVLQRRGIELMLESGRVEPERLGQFHYNLGTLAYDARDWAVARRSIEAATAAGYQQADVEGLIAETYFGEGQNAQGLTYLRGVIEQRLAAGQTVSPAWVRRGLSVAYNANMAQEAGEWSALLVANEPTQQNWLAALQVIAATNDLDPQAQLDLLRLMMQTGSLTERNLYETYVEAADPRIMSNEVDRVLAAGLQQGVFTSGDSFYTDVKRIVDERKATDRREAPQLAAEARSSAQGRQAMSAGDVFLSLQDYAQAEAMFALALEKGGVDRDRALTRLGIAQSHQNKNAEAKATFAQVSGARAPVARMWTAYVDTQA